MASGADYRGMHEQTQAAPRRPLVGWWQLAVLGASLTAAWGVFAFGRGMQQVLAWLALQVLPAAVVLGALVAAARAAWRLWRRRRGPTAETSTTRRARRLAVAAVATLGMYPLAWSLGIGMLRFPFALAETAPLATVRLPTDVTMRVLSGGDALEHNRHAAFPDQRWAYDLVVEPALVGSSRLEDYGCWSVPVVAPASGRVVAAHDGEPDHTPGAPSFDARAPLGNHVAIELATGGYLILAHLQNGSVSVSEGSVVAEGAAIGRCGNSGNTSEPHVHVHVQRQSPREGGEDRQVNFSEACRCSSETTMASRCREGEPSCATVRRT